ncbi:La protein [Phialemonium atrogriseum]|uniref:La protein n=1 Tax=Phialemonium atrogriseum TaxID=1093897 RepID=A0AAJ0FN71_9PEZI|nr:La protein [Phialemonium atrogriseum]KAK1766845.1 La protein [Phialemonium atrogriseum]
MSQPTAEAGSVSETKTQNSVPDVKIDDAVATETAADKPAKDGGAEVTTDQVVEKGESEANGSNDDKAKDGKTDEAKVSGDMLKTKARIDHKNRSSNRKFDPSVLPETDDPDKIRNQVEFYFGDSNLPTDKHMWNLTGGEENKPVSLKDICSFGRMRCFKPYSAVVAALKDSKTLIVSGDEGEEVVKRKKAYVPASDLAQARMAASVYVKGFGDEEPSTQFEIEAFFARYGPVNAIRLRRTPENLFKGSVFAEFQTEELAKKFLELDPAPTWKGHELMIMPKKAYVTDKTKKIQSGEIEASHNRPKRFYEGKEIGGRGNNRGRGRDSRRSGDPDDWKKRRDEDQKGGFKDRRHQRGRGGHGRGRGGRGGRGGRDGRNGRDNGEERTERADNEYVLSKPIVKTPVVQSGDSTGEAKAQAVEQPANGKRAREDDGGSEQPAKKVDTKAAEVSADAS